jgi:predicted MFS family arabinose efflux permease
MTIAALAPFRIRAFRFQWPADLVTSCAFEMETLILAWYVLVTTGSVVMLTIFGAMYYGGTLIAPMMGVISDRLGHRVLLSGMRALYAVVAATTTTLAFADLLSPYVVCGMAAITGLVRPSDMGLRGAMIAETMPNNRLIGAMSLSRSTNDVARIAGALTGAGVFTAFGIIPSYIIITSFYIAATLLTRCAVPEEAAAPQHHVEVVPGGSPWRDLREGFVHVWNTPRLLALVSLAFLYNLTAFPLTQGLLPYAARDIYNTDQTGLGYLVASVAIGALIGSLVLGSSRMEAALPRLMIVAALVWHVLLLIFAQMHTMPTGMLALLVVGFAQSFAMVSHTVILLRASGQRYRGRATGVRMMAIYSLPLGLLSAGLLIGVIGFHATATIYAATGFIFTLVVAWRWYTALADPRYPDDERLNPAAANIEQPQCPTAR